MSRETLYEAKRKFSEHSYLAQLQQVKIIENSLVKRKLVELDKRWKSVHEFRFQATFLLRFEVKSFT